MLSVKLIATFASICQPRFCATLAHIIKRPRLVRHCNWKPLLFIGPFVCEFQTAVGGEVPFSFAQTASVLSRNCYSFFRLGEWVKQKVPGLVLASSSGTVPPAALAKPISIENTSAVRLLSRGRQGWCRSADKNKQYRDYSMKTAPFVVISLNEIPVIPSYQFVKTN